MSQLVCPVCSGQMREVDKHGVHIDTCTQCRGVWLDRGELEKLADLMSGRGTGGPAAPNAPASGFLSGGFLTQQRQPPPAPPRRREWDNDDDDDDDRRRHRDGYQNPPPRRSSLLDFFD